MTDITKPPLPEPFDWCYEWDGPYGTRTFTAAPRNGMKATRSVPIYTAAQMRQYADAAVAAERERIAVLVETQDTYGDPVGCWFETLATKIRASMVTT